MLGTFVPGLGATVLDTGGVLYGSEVSSALDVNLITRRPARVVQFEKIKKSIQYNNL